MSIRQNRELAYNMMGILNKKLSKNSQIQFIGTSGHELTVMTGSTMMFNTNGNGDLWSNIVVFLNGVNFGMEIK